MQQFDPMVRLVRVDRDEVIDGEQFRRAILSDRVEACLEAVQLESEDRQDALGAFDEAGREGAEEQLDGIEGVGSSGEVRIGYQAGLLRGDQAAVAVEAMGADVIFEHGVRIAPAG
jgi:hypothetical protein